MARVSGITVTETARVNLSRLEDKTTHKLLAVMRASADELLKLAILNAPVDEGNLEEAIVKTEIPGSRGRLSIDIGIDEDLLAELAGHDYPYHLIMHESTYNLGDKSKEKARYVTASHPYARVGNKFIERAANSLSREIEARALRAVKESIR